MYVRKEYLLKHSKMVSEGDKTTLPSDIARVKVDGVNKAMKYNSDMVVENSNKMLRLMEERRERVIWVLRCNEPTEGMEDMMDDDGEDEDFEDGKKKNKKNGKKSNKTKEDPALVRSVPQINFNTRKRPQSFKFVHSDWLRCWCTGEVPPTSSSSPDEKTPDANEVIGIDSASTASPQKAKTPLYRLPGAVPMNNIEYICPHGVKTSPKTLHKFKLLSTETYEKLLEAVGEEEVHSAIDNCPINETNYHCPACESKYVANLESTQHAASKWHDLIATLNSPEATITSAQYKENPKDGGVFIISNTFVTALTSKFTKTCSTILKAPSGEIRSETMPSKCANSI